MWNKIQQAYPPYPCFHTSSPFHVPSTPHMTLISHPPLSPTSFVSQLTTEQHHSIAYSWQDKTHSLCAVATITTRGTLDLLSLFVTNPQKNRTQTYNSGNTSRHPLFKHSMTRLMPPLLDTASNDPGSPPNIPIFHTFSLKQPYPIHYLTFLRWFLPTHLCPPDQLACTNSWQDKTHFLVATTINQRCSLTFISFCQTSTEEPDLP